MTKLYGKVYSVSILRYNLHFIDDAVYKQIESKGLTVMASTPADSVMLSVLLKAVLHLTR